MPLSAFECPLSTCGHKLDTEPRWADEYSLTKATVGLVGFVVQRVDCWLSTNKSPAFDSLVLPKLGQWHTGLSFLPLQKHRQDQELRVIPGLRQLLSLLDYKTAPQQRGTKASSERDAQAGAASLQ